MSISSSLITNLTVWRNPQGAEENWKGYEHQYTHLPSLKTISISEAVYALIGVAALVESAVNAAFVLFSLPFLYISDQASKLPIERLQSSACAALWCAANLVLNIGVSNITTNEETVRDYTINTFQTFMKKFS